MKKIFTTLLIVFFISLCKAQQYLPPPIEWVKTFGGTKQEYAKNIIETSDGGYLVTGSTQSQNGNFSGMGSTQYYDAFISKLDVNGNLLLIKKIGGMYNDYGINAFETDDGGYMMGGTAKSSGPNAPIQWQSHGGFDYWVVKFDSLGAVQWTKCYGGSGSEGLINIIPSSDGGAFLLGNSDSNNGDIDTAMGLYFIWAVRIDSVGNILWNKSFGTSLQVTLKEAKKTSNGDGIICSVDVNTSWVGGSGGDVENADYLSQGGYPSEYENWFFKINDSGAIVWSSLIGTDLNTDWRTVDCTVLLRTGNIFIKGYDITATCPDPWVQDFYYYPILDANGIRVDSFYSFCNPEWYRRAIVGFESSDSMIVLSLFKGYPGDTIIKIDLDGNYMWCVGIPDSGSNNGLCSNLDGSFLECGYSFNVLSSNSLTDIQIVKYKHDFNCSLISNSISQTICFGDTFYCGGLPLTTQGGYSFTINSVSGCDSVINLTLSVLNPVATSLNQSICDGDVFDFNGVNLNTTGIYIDTLNSVNSCDSIITLNLTVETVNTSIQQSNDTLTTTNTGNIQWFDCNTQQIIAGATQNAFVPTVTGNYAAIITEGNCTDTSICINMIVNSINSITDNGLQFSLFPNPTNETVTVQFSQQANCKLEITNTLGQIVYAKTINHKSEAINLKLLPSGLYFCSVRTEDGKTAQQKLIVQH